MADLLVLPPGLQALITAWQTGNQVGGGGAGLGTGKRVEWLSSWFLPSGPQALITAWQMRNWVGGSRAGLGTSKQAERLIF